MVFLEATHIGKILVILIVILTSCTIANLAKAVVDSLSILVVELHSPQPLSINKCHLKPKDGINRMETCVRLRACVCVDVHACVQNRPVFSLSACLIFFKEAFRHAQDLSGLGVSRNTSLRVYMKNVVKALKHKIVINQSERKTIEVVYD